MRILISSCLVGKKCAYDGRARTIPGIDELCSQHSLFDICPEIEGGLSCPRDKHEIVGGSGKDVITGQAKVVSAGGRDSTGNFLKGALRALDTAKKNNIRVALLKSKSPSCGKDKIYNGCFNGKLRKGSGVTAQLLAQNHVRIYTEKELDTIVKDFRSEAGI